MARFTKSDFEVTPIVGYGAVFMLLVFGVMGLEAFWRHENALATRLVAVKNDLATQETLSGTDVWAARFEQSRAAQAALERALWTGATGGVIAAELQQSLRRSAQALDFERIQMSVDPSPVDLDGVMVISFDLSATAPDGKSIPPMVEAITKSPKRIIIKTMSFTQDVRDRRKPRLSIGGVVPVKIAVPSNTPASTGPNGGQP